MNRIFISYSHRDAEWKDRLVKHLRVLESTGSCDIWDDRKIDVGVEWLPAIESALDNANIVILLLSADFLVSPFIQGKEIPRILSRREKEGLIVIPIFVSPCAWKRVSWLSKIQGVPTDGRSLAEISLPEADKILVNLTEKIDDLIQKYEKSIAKNKGEKRSKVSDNGIRDGQSPSPKRGGDSRIERDAAAGKPNAYLSRVPMWKRKWFLFVVSTLLVIGIALGVVLKNMKYGGNKPEAVKAAEARAQRVYENGKGYWEADYGEGIIMVYIPAGEFPMGSNDGREDEKPTHTVYLDGYWLGKTEVTVKQFRDFANDENYLTEAETGDGAYTLTGKNWEKRKEINWKNPGFSQADNHPVVCVSWNDAVKYCQWLSKKKGVPFQLPTEAQWEKGARGSDGRKYPWGYHDPYYNGKYYANYAAHDSLERRGEDGYEYTAPVGSFPQGVSPYGLPDMAGNVWEWCNDWYKDDYYNSSPSKSPTGPVKGLLRVLRGGSWFNYGRDVRSASRGRRDPADGFDDLGFRLARGQEL